MSFLVDTNILLRIVESLHPHHDVAVGAVSRLLADDTPVYFTLQNIAEFWNVATRPIDRNGLGLPIPAVLAEVEKIENLLTLLPDTPAVYEEWKRVILDHNVFGVQVHDARLVAIMKTHGLIDLLTFNGIDFARYKAIRATHPGAIG